MLPNSLRPAIDGQCWHIPTSLLKPVIVSLFVDDHDALDDPNESEDDECEVAKALSQISAKITKGRNSQREEKSWKKKVLDTAYLNYVAPEISDMVLSRFLKLNWKMKNRTITFGHS